MYWNLNAALRETLIYLKFSRKKSHGMHGRATIAQAHAQDVSEILDPNYTPAITDVNLFDEKKIYVCCF